jgi:hypothetical protein
MPPHEMKMTVQWGGGPTVVLVSKLFKKKKKEK